MMLQYIITGLFKTGKKNLKKMAGVSTGITLGVKNLPPIPIKTLLIGIYSVNMYCKYF